MTPPAVDLPSLIQRFAHHPERTALSFYRGRTLSGRLSFGELSAKIESLAGALHDLFGVQAGDRVAILAPNGLEIPVLVLALLRLGAVVVPLNPSSATADWSYILAHSGARGVCATRELAARLPGGSHPAFVLHVEDVFQLVARAPPPAAPGPLDELVAVVLYTSGTTGDPKGVALRQRNLFWNAWSMAQNFRLDGTTQLAVLPLYHAHAFGFGLMTALLTGGHLVFTERLEPLSWAEVVRREAVEVASVVPTLLPMLLAAGVTRDKVPSLRHILVSSAPLTAESATTFETRAGIRLVQGWGLSEYTNFACCISPDLPAEEHELLLVSGEVPSIGPALEGSEVRVVAPGGTTAAEGERGELQIRGHSTMQGYFRDPEHTAAVLDSEGWLRTGDEGFFRLHRDRPAFFITGRIKEIIIRDAEKHSPLRLERHLSVVLPELAGRLVVLGFPHREHGEEVGAYVEIGALDGELLTRVLAAIQAMPVPERPKVVLHGTRPIPRTHTGKIQRRKMHPWFAAFGAHRGPTVVLRIEEDSSAIS